MLVSANMKIIAALSEGKDGLAKIEDKSFQQFE